VKLLNGYYEPLNDRLRALLTDPNDATRAPLFEIEEARDPGDESAPAAEDLRRRIGTWSPPQAVLRDDSDGQPARFFDELRERHAPLITASYTTLDRSRRARPELEPEDFKYDLEAAAETTDLPGGRRVGIFLHEVIEKLDLQKLADAADPASWKSGEGLKKLIADTMRRYQVRDPRWADRGAEVVFNALRTSIELPGGASIGPLCRCPSVREMEFVYPIPEGAHPLLASRRHGAWTVERGYLKGFVDFVFEHGGMTYFADWKSDLLSSYAAAAIETHVKQHYEMQAKIYSVGIVRLLQIENEAQYRERFGGLLYLFIRGVKAAAAPGGTDGVYFHRPQWNEIVRYEVDLIDQTRERVR
jgi:exodeoxyribonuclease V beta subunit